jgi:hypothetical protein
LFEHKVKLLEFLRSGRGALVVNAVVQRAAVAENDFWALAEGLPPVDLYVPHREHRNMWRASDPIAVAALVDEASPLVGYLGGGGEVPIDRLSTAPTATPVLLLGPAEAELIRPDAGRPPSRPDVIEDKSQESPMVSRAQCTENCGGGGGQPPPDIFLRLDTIVTFDVVDNGFSWETNEFEFRPTTPMVSTRFASAARVFGHRRGHGPPQHALLDEPGTDSAPSE